MLVILLSYPSVVPLYSNIRTYSYIYQLFSQKFCKLQNTLLKGVLPNGGNRVSGSLQTDFSGLMMIPAMKVMVSHPRKEIEVQGPTQVHQLLQQLNLTPEAYLVIRGDELVTEDTVLQDSDSIEIRSVISGG